MRAVQTVAVLTALVGSWVAAPWARAEEDFETRALGVGPQYETSHVYVSPEDVERFSTSLVATFGGTTSQRAVLTVTPTPSETNMAGRVHACRQLLSVRLQDADPLSLRS
jgi:hypothetical protein